MKLERDGGVIEHARLKRWQGILALAVVAVITSRSGLHALDAATGVAR